MGGAARAFAGAGAAAANSSCAEGLGGEEEDMSDHYSVRYSGYWKGGGLSGLAIDEDWGYTDAGTKCSNGRACEARPLSLPLHLKDAASVLRGGGSRVLRPSAFCSPAQT